MKKFMDKGFWFLAAALAALMAELVVVNQNLAQLSVLTYLLAIGIIPALILLVSSLLYAVVTKVSTKIVFASAIVLALVFSGVMLLYCSSAITPELMDTILANSVTSDTTQVSMTTASAGDNIQSIMIYVAFAGVGALIGNKIRRKKRTPVAAAESEYDI